jgi:predicted ATP-grasp superfamily ATP-dependent carboligase
MNDDGATFLSKYKQELIGLVPFLMPDWATFERGYDKNLLMALCKEKGYPHPITIDMEKVDYQTIKEGVIPFPAIIKPNYTSGGRGMTLVHNTEELKESYPSIRGKFGPCHLQQFIEAGGRQIKVQVFIDPRDGKTYSSVIHKQRFYPEKGGSSSCNMTITDDKTAQMCISILKDINWEGFADFDLIEDPKDGVLKVMEINPRIPACIKSAILSGIDYGTMIADVSLGKPLKGYTYKPGQKLRHIGFEMLWFKYSKNRWKAKPCWFNWIDPKLSFQDFSWRDPLPFFYGTWGNIKKQRNLEFQKEKSGLR